MGEKIKDFKDKLGYLILVTPCIVFCGLGITYDILYPSWTIGVVLLSVGLGIMFGYGVMRWLIIRDLKKQGFDVSSELLGRIGREK
jgi:hypothetical protein